MQYTKERGYLPLQLGKGELYFRLSTRAMIRVEEASGKTFQAFFSNLAEAPITDIILLIRNTAAVTDEGLDGGFYKLPLSEEAAISILDEVGLRTLSELFANMLNYSTVFRSESAVGKGQTGDGEI